MFMTSVPTRAAISVSSTISLALREFRAQRLWLRAYEHASRTGTGSSAGFPSSASHRERRVIFEERSFPKVPKTKHGHWETRQCPFLEQANFLLRFVARRDQEVALEVVSDHGKYANVPAHWMLWHTRRLFGCIADDPERRLLS
jgi:hypothetical protein